MPFYFIDYQEADKKQWGISFWMAWQDRWHNLLFTQNLYEVFVTAASVHPRLFHTEHIELDLYLSASSNLQNPHNGVQGYFQKDITQ